MARTDARFREAFNGLVDLCGGLGSGGSLPSETALAERLGVSRTIVRGALRDLDARGIVRWRGRDKTLVRPPGPEDRMEPRGGGLRLDELETRFLDWVLRFDVAPGTQINVTQMARGFGATPRLLQEFLSGLSRLGLVERRSRGGWRLLGFTADYAVELSDFRAVLEIDAVRHVVALPPWHPVWPQIDALEAAHLDLLERIERDFHEFSKLDERFHATVGGVVRNRFVAESRKVVSLIFHYHYQWDKADERQRNEAALREHLAWIAAMKARDEGRAVAAATIHLATSKLTLLASLRGNNLA